MTQNSRDRGNSPKESAAESLTKSINGAAMAPLMVGQSLAQEGLRFWALRANAYAELANAAATSKTASEFWEAYSAWLARTQQDYVKEGSALVELVAHRGDRSEPAP